MVKELAKVTDVMQGKKEEVEKALMGEKEGESKKAAESKPKESPAPTEKKPDTSEPEHGRVVAIGERRFEILSEYRINPSVFEALSARSAIVMNALDRARRDAYDREKQEREKPTYKHTIFLGQDDAGRNLRASISVFSNGVVVQTMREQ